MMLGSKCAPDTVSTLDATGSESAVSLKLNVSKIKVKKYFLTQIHWHGTFCRYCCAYIWLKKN